MRRLGWLAIALLYSSAAAALTVIHDGGKTESLFPLYRHLLGPTIPVPPSTTPDPKPALRPLQLDDLLPVHTPEMTPGSVAARAHPYPPGARPLFLVGADHRSQAWLEAHRDRLIALGAVGLLVEAGRPEDVARMAAAARGLPLSPASGSDLARALDLVHYPVLISRDGIRQ